MTSMIEKVARAMDPMSSKIADMLLAKGMKRADVLGILPMEKARAAIEAMREPTIRMTGEGWREVSKSKEVAGIARLGPGPGLVEGYRAMIDAALSE